MRKLAGLGLVCCLMLGSVDSIAGDAWKGKHRSDVVALLGEPSKTKKSADGASVLIYKLIRVGDKAVPNPSFRVFDLPGVGRVGRVVKNEDPGFSETTTFEPSGLDERGRPSAGGVGRTRTASTSWDPKTGERAGLELPQKGPQSRGKVKLKFTLDAADNVRDWSVSKK